MALVVCAACARHIRRTEGGCPFCGAEREASDSPEPVVSRARSRGGIVVGVTVGAVAISSALLGSACAAYGGPVFTPDAGHDAAAASGDSGSDAP